MQITEQQWDELNGEQKAIFQDKTEYSYEEDEYPTDEHISKFLAFYKDDDDFIFDELNEMGPDKEMPLVNINSLWEKAKSILNSP